MRIAFEGNKRFKDMFVGFHALIYIFVSVDLDSRVTGSPRSLCIFNSNPWIHVHMDEATSLGH
jgi:hypothetical protein